MRYLIIPFALVLAWGAALSPALADGPGVRIDPGYRPPPMLPYPGITAPPAYQPAPPPRPKRYYYAECDAYGRCWERVPYRHYDRDPYYYDRPR